MSSEQESMGRKTLAPIAAIDGLRRLEDPLILLGIPFLEDGRDAVLNDEAFISHIKIHAMEVKAGVVPLISDDLAKIWSKAEECILGLTVASDPKIALVLSVAICFVRCSLEGNDDLSIELAIANLRAHPTFRSKISDLCNSSELRKHLFETP